MRDLGDWQERVFGVREDGPEKPATQPEIPKGVPTLVLHCQLCEYTSAVMQGFESLFYLEHVPGETPELDRHYVRAAPRERK